MYEANSSTQIERRTHHAVRKIFLDGCVLLAPFIKGNDEALNTSGFAMLQMVQSHFSGISSAEAKILIDAIERLHRDNRLQALIDNHTAHKLRGAVK